MFFIFRVYKENNYDPIDYACIDETKFQIVDGDESRELDIKEMKK